MSKKYSIVIPIYNEEKRLEKLFNEISKITNDKFFFNKTEFILVNDGSNDKSFLLINDFIKKKNKNIDLKFINIKINSGKGFAIKKGVIIAKNEWIFTMDADLSVNFNQIKKWFTKYELKFNRAYFGSRSLKSSKVRNKIHRHIIRIILRALVYLFIDNRIRDTQCGFKLYNKSYIQKIFPLLTEKGFIHDIEIIILLKRNKIEIKELPIKWVHFNNSKVRLLTDPIIFFFKLFYIFYKYKKN